MSKKAAKKKPKDKGQDEKRTDESPKLPGFKTVERVGVSGEKTYHHVPTE